jgi:hypothetical protein
MLTPLNRRTHYSETSAASCPVTVRNGPEGRRLQETEDQNCTQGIRPDDWRTDDNRLRSFLETKPWFCSSEHFHSTYPLRGMGHTFLSNVSTSLPIPDYTLQGVSHNHRLGNRHVESCCLFSESNSSRLLYVANSCYCEL